MYIIHEYIYIYIYIYTQACMHTFVPTYVPTYIKHAKMMKCCLGSLFDELFISRNFWQLKRDPRMCYETLPMGQCEA